MEMPRGFQHVAVVRIDRPMSGNQSNVCERIRARIPSVEHFTPHDLRRTAGTLITRLGHTRFIMDRVMNHTDDSIGRVYDRFEYAAERLAAVSGVGMHTANLAKGNAIIGSATAPTGRVRRSRGHEAVAGSTGRQPSPARAGRAVARKPAARPPTRNDAHEART